MPGSENSQHAIRRSTRLPLEVPVRVTSLNATFRFSAQCNTTLVNAHGCGVISPQEPERGLQVRIEIVSARRHTTARVAEVVPLGGDPETWLVGLELDIPGNFWGIEYAPSDWKVEEGPPSGAQAPISSEPAKPPGSGRRWRLTDISAGACYLEHPAPFATGSAVLISVRTVDKEYLLDGIVLVSHPRNGMAVEFAQGAGQRQKVKELISQLAKYREGPKIFVGRKEVRDAGNGPDAGPADFRPVDSEAGDSGAADTEAADPLLELVQLGPSLSAEQFLADLRSQRLGKRRDPRIDIALPVLLTGTDLKGRPLDQRVMTRNISRRGALLEGIHGIPSEGDKISLARGRKKEEFRIAWVVDDDAAAGARIGVAAVEPNSSFWDEVLEATSQSGLEAASLRGVAESGIRVR